MVLTRYIRNRARAERAFRKGLLLALLAAAALGLVCPAQANAASAPEMRGGWWLLIKNAACSQGPKVLLGDIAVPQGDMPAATWKEISARPLWNAPERTGHQTALSRERLLAMLRHYAQDLAEACTLPSQIVVQRGGAVIAGQDINQRIVNFLTSQSEAFVGEIELKDTHGPDYIFLANERDRLVIKPSSPLRPGRVNLLLEATAGDGKTLRRYAASAFVNVWRALPVPTRPVNRLQQLDLANVQFKRANMAFNPNAWDGTGGPWRMVRSVGAGQVIHRSDIEPVPVISRGDKVTLVFEGENLRLQVKAEALCDGGIGQRIEVRNLQSNRKIVATVQDAETVVVR